jgi:AraC-like DNA-binding protein
MKSKVYLPAISLRSYISKYQMIEYQGDGLVHQCTLPKAATGIIFLFQEAGSNIFLDNKLINWRSFFSGFLLKGITANANGYCKAMIVIFTPLGAHHLFKISQGDYLNKFIQLEDIIGPIADSITDQILSLKDSDQIIMCLNEFFIRFISNKDDKVGLLGKALKIIESKNGNIAINELERNINLSERTIEHKFQNILGITPKQYAWIVRLNRAYNMLLHTPDIDYHKIVYSLGYFDQSHFINDIKKFSNMTPLKLKEGDNEMLKHFD